MLKIADLLFKCAGKVNQFIRMGPEVPLNTRLEAGEKAMLVMQKLRDRHRKQLGILENKYNSATPGAGSSASVMPKTAYELGKRASTGILAKLVQKVKNIKAGVDALEAVGVTANKVSANPAVKFIKDNPKKSLAAATTIGLGVPAGMGYLGGLAARKSE